MHVRVGGTYALLLYCLSKVEVFFWIILSRSNTTERITDASSTKRNLFFSTAHRATKADPLQARISLRDLPRNEVSISDFEREREREREPGIPPETSRLHRYINNTRSMVVR